LLIPLSSAPTPTTFLTTTTASAPTQTAQATLPRSDSSSSPDTGVVVGAVLGSILGTFVLITLLYKCCFDNRSAAWIPTFSSYDSDTDSERSSPSSRVHRRGGGGDGFGLDNRRGDRVRRPRRAKTRRRRRREESGSRSERSWSTRRGSRRTSGMSNYDGLLGWFLVPRTTPYRSRYTERKQTRSSWAGGGGRGGTADD
jgi:hypothetical protein